MPVSSSAREAAPPAIVVSPPEPGQLVEVRRRQWVVADAQSSAIGNGHSSPQHLLTLSSIDEDSLGEQIEVVWEIEPGAHVMRKSLQLQCSPAAREQHALIESLHRDDYVLPAQTFVAGR